MINSVDKKLSAWAVWAEIGNLHGLGFKDSTLSRVGGVSATTEAAPEFMFDPHLAAELEIIDRLVAGGSSDIECIRPSSSKVIVTWYRTTGTATQKARDLGCCNKTLYIWLERAQQDLARCLDQVKYGVRMRGVSCRFIDTPDAVNEKY